MEERLGTYYLWINWTDRVVSFHQMDGYDCLPFTSQENYHANIRILLQAGFLFG